MRKIELLSPAGDKACALSAINAGADAIYLGGKNFSARSSANNFTDTEILETIDYAHLRGVKVYITINTLYKQDELENVFKFVNLMHSNGADSFILQDIGTASFLLKNFSNIVVHASTQMTVHDLSGVLFLQNLGFKRVVLSRELTLDEIRHITKNTTTEIEVFGHGALCYSYSGQCTASSLIGSRSGNRGKCAQPCRQNYKLLDQINQNIVLDEGYLLSPKDMVSLPVLKDIIQSGVTSLKIEGRMKDENYVHLTTKTYREQIDRIYDNNFNINPKDIKNLTAIFNRGGNLSTGYFENYSSINLMSTNTPSKTGTLVGKIEKYDYRNKKATFTTTQKLVPGDRVGVVNKNTGCNINFEVLKNKKATLNIDGNIEVGDEVYKTYDKELFDYIKQSISKDLKKLVINADFTAELDKPISLRLYNDSADITILGVCAQPALKNPMDEETIISKLSKTGSTTFVLDFKKVSVDHNIFLNIKDLNELRRLAIDEFTKKYLDSFKKPNTIYSIPKNIISEPTSSKNITIYVRTREQFVYAISEGIYAIYVDYNIIIKDPKFFITTAKNNDVKLYVSLPTVSRFDDLDEICNNIKLHNVEGLEHVDGYLVKNYGELYLIKSLNKNIVINYNFSTLNNLSLEFFNQIAERTTLSYELNFSEINKLDGEQAEIVVYGKLPVMTVATCPIGIYLADKHGDRFCSLRFSDKNYTMKDDKGYEFTVKPNCYNCYSEIFNSSVLYLSDKLKEVLGANPKFIRLEFLDEDENTIKNLIKFHKGILDKCIISEKNITYGHYNRGIL